MELSFSISWPRMDLDLLAAASYGYHAGATRALTRRNEVEGEWDAY